MCASVSSESTVVLGGTTQRHRCRLPVVRAEGADHAAIYFFLKSIFQTPTREEFNASLEDPFYEPSDRLLIRRGRQITAHAQITHRTMQFGSLSIPMAGLQGLATLPECQSRGQASHLLKAAEKQMARDGALIGWLRTSIPYFFRHTGWALCGRHCFSRADARTLRAKLLDHGLRRQRRPQFQIRPWRLWEKAALARTYNQNLPEAFGAMERTDAYWQWLINRQAYDQIYVALEGPDLLELEEVNTRIVGYAVTQGENILELATAPDRRKAATELLGRACGDAIEHNRYSVTLHAPPTSSMHNIFRHAGGTCYHHEADQGQVFMVRVLNPLKLLRCLGKELGRRADEAGLTRPLELGLAVDHNKYLLSLTRSGVKIVSRQLGRSYLQLNVADFTRLLLGQLDWETAIDDGRLTASTNIARQIGPVLFPPLPLWWPQFDNLGGKGG